MDHRHHYRWPVRLDVELYYGGRCLGSFKTRDISWEGLFIETRPIAIRPNEPVRLFFTGQQQNIGGEPITAFVVHCSNGGIGLMLHEADSTLSVLRRQLLISAA